MKDQVKKFLEFNGRKIYFLAADGEWWIAIKPICEALNVEYTRIFKNLKEDDILGQLLARQPMVGADNRTRMMVSLPERYVYGWLFQIRSESPELRAYKKECYDLLYNYFHGAITGRKELLGAKAQVRKEMEEIENRMVENEEFLRHSELKAKQKRIDAQLRGMDSEVMEEQLTLFTKSSKDQQS